MFDVAQPAGAFPDPPVPEFVLIRDLSGVSAEIDFGAGRFTTKPSEHSMIIAPPNCDSNAEVNCPHRLQILSLPTSRLHKWAEDDIQVAKVQDLARLHTGSFKSNLVEGLLDHLWTGAAQGMEASYLQTDAALMTLWAELLREARRLPNIIARGGLAPWQSRRCIEYLNDHVHENIGIETLAGLVGLSPYHFARAFKRSNGMPPHRYQTNLRIEKAKALLIHSRQTITQIAFEVGYESSQALARVFRQQVGVPPTEYRRSFGILLQ